MNGPHQNQKVVTAGEPLIRAIAAMILVHGRGATAESILDLTNEFESEGFAFLAPQANDFTWYPYGFLAPMESNEPGMSSGIQAIADAVATIEEAGIPSEKIILLGFSQGACLSLEFAARNAKRYGGVVGLSGGLIGPEKTPRNYNGTLDGTPIFLGCDDHDFHIPASRVRESAEVFKQLNADVTMRLYQAMGHGVSRDEIQFVNDLMRSVVSNFAKQGDANFRKSRLSNETSPQPLS